MAQTYEVQYQINVNTGQALEAIKQFQQATTQLEYMTRRFNEVSRSIGKLNSAFHAIGKNTVSINIDTKTATKQIEGLLGQIKTLSAEAKNAISIGGLDQIKTAKDAIKSINKSTIQPTANTTRAIESLEALIAKLNEVKGMSNIKITASAAGASAAATTGSSSTPKISDYKRKLRVDTHNYLGNVYAGSGTNMAGEMIKGMGYAYGLSALFSGIGSAFTSSAEYDNITKTTRNILATHDNDPNFQGRFDEMNRLMRQVGVETKFTAPQVADAGKFLAMAGLNIDEISSSIRPIADIALVGDTDLGETADVVTNIMTAYEIPANKMNRVADIMTSTFTSSNVTLMEMAESFKYSATLFKKAGVPFEVAAASLGILGDAGIKGSQGGTTMRTILANIANPTKKQKERWDAIGVKRYDDNGNLRDVMSVFADLSEKNLSISDFYGLFHKTAAQGAAALTSAVEKWNDIVADNFMSNALASKLAQEKKNTIQGLWYQITSAFTESGMKAFEILQEPIKNFLRDLLNMFQSSEFTRVLKNLMELTLEAGKAFMSAIQPIVSGFSYLFSFDIGVGAFKLFIYIQTLGTVFSSALKMIISTTKAIKSFTLITTVLNLSRLIKIIWHLKTIKALSIGGIYAGMHNRMAAFERLQSIRAINPTFMSGAGISILTRFLGLMKFAPIALAVGIGAIGYSWYRNSKNLEEYAKSLRKMNGIDLSEHATQTDKYLKNVYNKQTSVNDKLEEYIRLRKEELGLISGGVENEDKSTTFGDKYKDKIDLYEFSWSRYLGGQGFAASDAFNLAKETIGAISENNPYRPKVTMSPDGTYLTFGEQQYNVSNVKSLNKFQAASLLYELGSSTKKGSEAAAIVEEFNSRFQKVTNKTEWNQVMGALEQRMDDFLKRIDPSLGNLSLSEWAELPAYMRRNAPQYVYGLIASIRDQMGFDGYESENFKKLNLTKGLILKVESGQEITSEDLQYLLNSYGVAVHPETGLLYGGGEGNDFFTNKFGYSYDQKKFLGTPNKEPGAAMEDVKTVYGGVLEVVNGFNAFVAEKAFKQLLNLPQWKEAAIGASVSNGKKRFNGPTGEWETIEEENDFTNITNSLHAGSDQSEYKSHYSQSSAPKQVIVKIENLMRVDQQTIDMTDDRQVAAVNSIKQELATALLDVVQDFNANIM